MTDQNSEAIQSPEAVLDSEAMGEAVGGWFTVLAEQYQPTVDLVPTALAQARRDKRRRLAWGIGGGVVTFAAAVAVAVIAIEPGGAGITPAVGSETSHAMLGGTVNPACAGKWLPWTSGSDASLFGKGTDAQRAVVCTEDIGTLNAILPGAKVAPYYETFAAGSRTDFTPDQIAKLGPGTAPDTHILEPWQYSVTRNGHSGYFFITYSATRTDLCNGCGVNTSQALPGPPGYRLVQQTSSSGAQQGTNEDLIETPRHTYLGIGVSPLTGGTFVAPVEIDQLVHNASFITALDQDLVELYGE